MERPDTRGEAEKARSVLWKKRIYEKVKSDAWLMTGFLAENTRIPVWQENYHKSFVVWQAEVINTCLYVGLSLFYPAGGDLAPNEAMRYGDAVFASIGASPGLAALGRAAQVKRPLVYIVFSVCSFPILIIGNKLGLIGRVFQVYQADLFSCVSVSVFSP